VTHRPYTLILINFIAIIINSCRFPCDGFPNEDLKWLPYKFGDTIKYTNNIDTIGFEVVDFFQSERSDEKGYVVFMDVECGENAYYETETNLLTGYRIRESALLTNPKIDIEVQPGKSIAFYRDTEYKFDKNVSAVYYSEKVINDNLYKEVYEIAINIDSEEDYGSISRIIIIADFGIFEFYDSNTGETWKLIN
jgi:hypothetical protein